MPLEAERGAVCAPAGGWAPVLYATAPPFVAGDPRDYAEHVASVARWSEEAGCEGILVYTDNSLLDPWLCAQLVIQATHRLVPLVAVQPVYMHPYAVAKMIATLAELYGRRIDLNMVAGGFKTDLAALCDDTPHDRRYDRLVEYTTIVKRLALGGPVTFAGDFHRVVNLALTPKLPAQLVPRILVSGSSEAGLAASKALGALPVQYPAPASENAVHAERFGIRVGIVARESEEEAWAEATRRFPEDRAGQLKHQLAMKVSDSSWHQQLSGLAKEHLAGRDTYWMVPFTNYKTFCPYLVGTYATVGAELARHFREGCEAMILDVPIGGEELEHVKRAIHTGAEQVVARA
jgi:alkanesulfonate monooxygenase